MKYHKNWCVLFHFGFLLFLVMNVGFSVCKEVPDFVQVQSGSFNVGEVKVGSSVFVKPDLNAFPLELKFVFENSETGCYDENSVKFALISDNALNKGERSVEELEGGGEKTIFKFFFQSNLKISSVLKSKVAVNNLQGGSSENFLFLRSDDVKPELKILGFNSNKIYRAEEKISIGYQISDFESGLKSFRVTGGKAFIADYSDFSGATNNSIFEDFPSESTSYLFYVEDRLGNSFSETVEVKVDSSAPKVRDIKKTYFYDNGKRFVYFSVFLKDDSFKEGFLPIIFGDFSKFNSELTKKTATCEKSAEEDEFVCNFGNLAITDFTETKTVEVKFDVRDSAGNNDTVVRNEEIFVDNGKPEVLEFYVNNSLGVKNKFSVFDRNISIVLKAKDEAFNNDYTILAEFEDIDFPPKPDCDFDSGSQILVCRWELNNLVEVFAGFSDLKEKNFSVVVKDEYGNSNRRTINVKIDSEMPEIESIELIEEDSIKTGVLKSGSKISFRLKVKDKNLIDNYLNFVTADFSKIDYRQGLNYSKAKCYMVEDYHHCDFENIVVERGYFNRTIIFYVMDLMGNLNKREYPIEVFKISEGEVGSSFSIDDMYILNPISRERILEGVVTAWFEGSLNVNDAGMRIVNYQYVSCNESTLKPFKMIPSEEGLFPSNIVYYEDEDDKDFAFKLRIMDHPSYMDLVPFDVTCRISVLKRDETTLYPPEMVDFNLKVDFFDSQRQGFVKATAQELLQDIDDADLFGEKFDVIFQINQAFTSVCNVVSGANEVISAVSSVWTPISTLLSTNSVTEAVAKVGDTAVFPTDGALSEVAHMLKPVEEMCRFVTCDYDRFLGDVNNWFKDLTSGMCGGTGGGKDGLGGTSKE